MVKVLIDGKEYEGKDIIVSNYDTQVYPERDACETTHAYHFKAKKPTQIVCVPKEIQFAPITDAETGTELGLGLIINNKELFYDEMDGNWNFGSYGVIDENPVECVLIPTTRDDLKTGDWAFWLLKGNMENELQYIGNYYLITESVAVRIKGADAVTDAICIEESYPDTGKWFRVVSKNEFERQKAELIKGLQNFPRR